MLAYRSYSLEANHVETASCIFASVSAVKVGWQKKKSVERVEAHRIDERTGVQLETEAPKAEV